jgi:hypothetical protein
MTLDYETKTRLLYGLFVTGLVVFVAAALSSAYAFYHRKLSWVSMLSVGLLILSSFLLVHPSFSARELGLTAVFIVSDAVSTLAQVLILFLRIFT